VRRESPFDLLPEGLPSGRLITPEQSRRPVLWVSDEPLPDAGPQWARLFALHERTGLYPLLLDTLRGEPGRPWHDGELDPPLPVSAIDMLSGEGVLRRFWDQVVPEPAEGADDAEPSGPWPGLAPPGEPDPDAVTHREKPWRQTMLIHDARRVSRLSERQGSNPVNSVCVRRPCRRFRSA
jgi:hypothetical protein